MIGHYCQDIERFIFFPAVKVEISDGISSQIGGMAGIVDKVIHDRADMFHIFFLQEVLISFRVSFEPEQKCRTKVDQQRIIIQRVFCFMPKHKL